MCTTNYKELHKDDPQTYQGRVEELYNIFLEVQSKYKLQNFKFKVNGRLKRSLGQCTYNRLSFRGEVQVSKSFIEHGDWIGVIDTLLHECAHAIDFNNRGTSDHSWKWKRIARAIGAMPNRVASTQKTGEKFTEVNEKQYTYGRACPNCGVLAKYYRKPTSKSTYRCVTCREKVEVVKL